MGALAGSGQFHLCRFQLAQHPQATLQKQRALGSQGNAARTAVQQAHAQVLFQAGHAFADRRGRHPEVAPGGGKTAGFGRLDEKGDAAERFHNRSIQENVSDMLGILAFLSSIGSPARMGA